MDIEHRIAQRGWRLKDRRLLQLAEEWGERAEGNCVLRAGRDPDRSVDRHRLQPGVTGGRQITRPITCHLLGTAATTATATFAAAAGAAVEADA